MNQPKLSDKFLLKRGLHYFLLDKQLALKSFLLLLIETSVSLLGPWIWKVVLDDYILANKTDGLLQISVVYLLLYVIWGIITYFMLYNMSKIGLNGTYAMRKDTFEHLQVLDLDFYDTNKSGDIMSRLLRDIDNMQEWTSVNVIYSVGGLFFTIFAYAIMLTISPYLALTSLAILPFIVIVSYLSKKYARPAWKKQIETDTEHVNYVTESIQGIKVSQSYVNKNESTVHHNQLIENDYQAFNRAFRIDVPLYVLYTTLASLASVLIYYIGGNLVVSEDISVGELFLFITYQTIYLQHITHIFDLYSITQSVFSSYERVITLQEIEPSIKNSGSIELTENGSGIEMRNVNFRYRDGPLVLKDLNLSIPPKQSLAIVGSTGSGKTSISNILLRFYEYEAGEVEIFSTNIRNIELGSLRKNIGYVSQEPILFSGTIRDNINCSREIDDNEVLEAIQEIGAKFILEKENGLDFHIDEDGSNLSTGQKQLICLVRAVITQPPILVFDEATASIDHQTEEIITQNLSKLLEDRISIIIAHRLSTIKHVDRIIVVEDGEIVEDGSYDELVRHKGKFSSLVLTSVQNN